ncbi:hypothetical protein MRX96_006333 [Rhipicephalus microplus]
MATKHGPGARRAEHATASFTVRRSRSTAGPPAPPAAPTLRPGVLGTSGGADVVDPRRREARLVDFGGAELEVSGRRGARRVDFWLEGISLFACDHDDRHQNKNGAPLAVSGLPRRSTDNQRHLC